MEQTGPDVFYGYNPFIFSFELEHIFYKDYYEFLKIYDQHKENYLKSVEESSEE